MDPSGRGSGQANSVSRSNSEITVNNVNQNNRTRSLNNASFSSIDPDALARRAEITMEVQEASESSMSTIVGKQQQRRRSIDPFDMYVQLKKQQNQKQQQQEHAYENGDSCSFNSNVSLGSFSRINTFGSLANIGSMNKMSCGDVSMTLSSQAPPNGKNNQLWNYNPMNPMNERLHSSLPILSAAGRMDNGSNLRRFGPGNMGMNAEMNASFSVSNMHGNHRSNDLRAREPLPNEFMPQFVAADDVATSYFGAGNNLSQSAGNLNNYRAENVHSGVVRSGLNESLPNLGSGFSINASPDLSKLTNEQLRQMVLMDSRSNGVGDSQHTVSTGTISMDASNKNQGRNANPFLKNLGLMNYRNHVLPLSLQRHSAKARRGSRCGNSNEDGHLVSTVSDLASTGHSSITTDFNMSNSNFSLLSVDTQGQDDHGMMPDEMESYNAAANGILAPWSARAAGLFGDMMIQSTEDEKARKASRKKPKDKPKRPLSAYNIFFKEERNRILEKEAQEDSKDADIPTTINISSDSFDQEALGDAVTTENKNIDESGFSFEKKFDPNSIGGRKKIGFESLAKLIGRRWQELDEESMTVYKSKASVDMERYKKEMEVWDAKHGTTSRKRGSRTNSGSNQKKSKRPSSPNGESVCEIAQESAGDDTSTSPLILPTKEDEINRRNSKGDSLDLSPHHASFCELKSDLFDLKEVEEDTNGVV